MVFGSMPNDGGNLILELEEYAELITKEPHAQKYIRRFMMGYEFINNAPRYCLWLVDAPPAELLKMTFIIDRVEKCR